MARIQRIVRDLGSFSHADEDVNVPHQRQHRGRIGADDAAQRAQVPRARRTGPARHAAGAGQRAAAGTGVPEPDLERRAGAGRGERQAQPGPRAQLRRRRPRRRRGDRTTAPASRPRRCRASSSRSSRPSRAGWGPGWAADLARHRAQPGRRDQRRQPAGRRGDVPRAHSRQRGWRRRRARRCPRRRRRAVFLRRRILAVDDEALLLKAYRRMLAEAHELVDRAGRRTRRWACSKSDSGFDVVLCDLQMPEMSGMELHAAVARALSRRSPNRFVFVTGGAFSGDARRFLEEAVPGGHPEAVQRRRSAGADRHHRVAGVASARSRAAAPASKPALR